MIFLAFSLACGVSESTPAGGADLYPPCNSLSDCQDKFRVAAAEKNDVFSGLYARDACERGDEDLCIVAATNADPRWQSANLSGYCLLHPGKICVEAGDFDVAKNWVDTAVKSYNIGCNGDYLPACDAAAAVGVEHIGIREDAAASAIKGCRAGSNTSCKKLGLWFVQDNAKANELLPTFETGCDLGALDACSVAGLSYVFQTTPPDIRRAEALFRKACDGGAGSGCSGLAVLMVRDHPERTPDAYPLASRGCAQDDLLGCRLVAVFTLGGSLPSPDYAAGYAAAKRGCELGEVIACEKAAQGIEGGKFAGTADESAKYRKYACDRGYARSCGAHSPE